MVLYIEKLVMYLSFIAPILVVLFGVLILKDRSIPYRIISAGSIAVSLGIALTLIWTSWLVKDGWGPDSVQSSGIKALSRTARHIPIGGIIVVLLFFFLGIFLCKSTKGKN